MKDKRKSAEEKVEKQELSQKGRNKHPAEKDGSSSDAEAVDVDFELFNMDLEDFHTIRNFLGHHFGNGASNAGIDVSTLAGLITDELAEYVGTTAKSEGEKSDPLAFATVLPLSGALWGAEKQKAVHGLKDFIYKMVKKAEAKGKEAAMRAATRGKSAVIFCERFINLPAELAAPMYQQLLADYSQAELEDPAFKVDHVFLFTPTYREIESSLTEPGNEDDDAPPPPPPKPKKSKKQKAADSEIKYYYDEMESLEGFAESSWDFDLMGSVNETSDSRRIFGEQGIQPHRRLFLVTMPKLKNWVDKLSESFFNV